jgi:hypothetical protein
MTAYRRYALHIHHLNQSLSDKTQQHTKANTKTMMKHQFDSQKWVMVHYDGAHDKP